MKAGRVIDVTIVTYNPNISDLNRLLTSLSEQEGISSEDLFVFIHDNSCNLEEQDVVFKCLMGFEEVFGKVFFEASKLNLGFGKGHNRAVSHGESELILLLNQDLVLEPDALINLLETVYSDDAGGLWEMRQIPYEHPKIYDPVTLATPWASGAAFLIRRNVFESIEGFDKDIFMYGEDVDLSWRVKHLGYEVRYVPLAAARHDTYKEANQVKPLQALEGTYSNLCLRARYASGRVLFLGILQWFFELFMPNSFSGRRKSLLRIGLRFARNLSRIRYNSRAIRKSPNNPAQFYIWNYAVHRDGAFFPFKQRREWKELPLVSILIRTCGRVEYLREALLSATRQTYPNVQVVVVEDGEAKSQPLIDTEFSHCNVKYEALGTQQGRSVAGNRALEISDGEWLCFLDDDDLLFLDHCEVLLQSALEGSVKAAYGWSWEVPTKVKSNKPLIYEEIKHLAIYKQEFNRCKIWMQNYLPIQTVLFHRALYEKWGGFDESMDQLEDWNLWVRYSLEDDFLMVPKTTSKYRVPSSASVAKSRQNALDLAYEDAMKKHEQLVLRVNPAAVAKDIGNLNLGVREVESFTRFIKRKIKGTRIGGFGLSVYRGLKRRFL